MAYEIMCNKTYFGFWLADHKAELRLFSRVFMEKSRQSTCIEKAFCTCSVAAAEIAAEILIALGDVVYVI